MISAPSNPAEKNEILSKVHGEEPLDLDVELERYGTIGERLAEFVCDTGALLRQASRDGREILFEGAQGMMLDLDHGTYPYVTSSNTGVNGVPSGAGSMPDSEEIVASLAKRLEDNPDDVNGWVLLGRSYQSMQQYGEAIAAFEKALELEQGQSAQTMVALGIALMESRGGELTDRSSSLFENALALEPNNPNALFYGGSAAASRPPRSSISSGSRTELPIGNMPIICPSGSRRRRAISASRA